MKPGPARGGWLESGRWHRMKSQHDKVGMQHFPFSRKALFQERAFTARPKMKDFTHIMVSL